MKSLAVNNLHVVFGDNVVINDVSFEIEEGDYLMVLGPNGAGKSVLFKSILGIVPYSGQIRIFGQTVAKNRGAIGYVPQYVSMDRDSPMTVRELVGLGCRYDGEKLIKMVEMMVKQVGLSQKIDHRFGELSGGQMKRVLLARALASQPKILFLDEPLAGVDALGEQKFFDLLEKKNKEEKITIIMISHDFNMIRKAATKVLCLNNTKLCFGGPEKINQMSIEKTFGRGVGLHIH